MLAAVFVVCLLRLLFRSETYMVHVLHAMYTARDRRSSRKIRAIICGDCYRCLHGLQCSDVHAPCRHLVHRSNQPLPSVVIGSNVIAVSL